MIHLEMSASGAVGYCVTLEAIINELDDQVLPFGHSDAQLQRSRSWNGPYLRARSNGRHAAQLTGAVDFGIGSDISDSCQSDCTVPGRLGHFLQVTKPIDKTVAVAGFVS